MSNHTFPDIPDLSADFEQSRQARRRSQTVSVWFFLVALAVFHLGCTWGGSLAGLLDEAARNTFWRSIIWGHLCGAAGLLAGAGAFLQVSLFAYGIHPSAHAVRLNESQRAAARSLVAPTGLMYCTLAGVVSAGIARQFIDLPQDATPWLPWLKCVGAGLGTLVAAAGLAPVYLFSRV